MRGSRLLVHAELSVPLATADISALDITTLGIILAVILLAGTVTGIAGFGFALVGTMALATVLPPSVAVVLLIVPILATNLSLIGELDRSSIRSCSRRFYPYIGATIGGTVVGMWRLEAIPAQPLTLTLGLLTLAYVGEQTVSIPGVDRLENRCFVERPSVMIGVGSVSGLVFGATNVGVQIVAYIQRRQLGRTLFVGVIALIFLGINTVRVGAAGLLGLYPSLEVALLSIGLVVPTVAGVVAGRRLRPFLTPKQQRVGVHGLLAVIGLRLVFSGLGIA